MLFIIFLVTVVFTYIGFASGESQRLVFNPLYTFYFFEGKFILNNIFPFLWGFLVVMVYFFVYQGFKRDVPWGRKWQRSAVQTAQVFILGFLLSSLVLFFIAGVELNVLAVLFNHNPGSLGVVTDHNAIAQELITFDRPPKIITSEKDRKMELVAIAQALAGKSSFYGNFVLPAIPGFLVWPVKKQTGSLLLIDDTLVITEINQQEIQEVSSVIGHLFVKQLFLNRSIRSYPNVMIMSSEEYKKFRRDDFDNKLKLIDEMLEEVGGNIASVSAEIGKEEGTINQKQKEIKESYAKIDAQYLKCLNSDTAAICENSKRTGYEEVAQTAKEADLLNEQLDKNRTRLAEYQLLEKFYQSQVNLGQALMENIPFERGAFDPPQGIKLTWGDSSSHAVADYMETLVHEYLHYASYVSEEKKLADPFFEEGLTEYYARMAIKNSLDTSTNLGYPVIVKIIAKMAKNIPDSDLADIYFNKDQQKLETVLDRVFGDNFYQDSRLAITTLQYSQDAKTILPLANLLMKKMGGTPLTEQDLVSSFSSYNIEQKE